MPTSPPLSPRKIGKTGLAVTRLGLGGAPLGGLFESVPEEEAQATLKAVTLTRTRDLRGQGIVSESDLDLAVSEDRQARAQVRLDEAEIQSAEARLRQAEGDEDSSS